MSQLSTEDLAALRAGRAFFAMLRDFDAEPYPGSIWIGPIFWETDES